VTFVIERLGRGYATHFVGRTQSNKLSSDEAGKPVQRVPDLCVGQWASDAGKIAAVFTDARTDRWRAP
jgi:hypothetical protein